jgi:hypothetical protein
MAEVEVSGKMANDSRILDEAALSMQQAHQQAWDKFAEGAVRMIPALKAQMFSVTQETERAAVELLVHLQALTSPDQPLSTKDRANSISKVVMAIQFQDITRQKLQHVGLALDQLKSHMEALLKGPQNEAAKKQIVALERVELNYTMEEERRLHKAAVTPDYQEPIPSERSDEEGDSVTIF